jgi:hypothetical protein
VKYCKRTAKENRRLFKAIVSDFSSGRRNTPRSEKPRQARAIPKKPNRHVRFRKNTAGTRDSEKPRQARAIPKNHGRRGKGHPEIPL